MGRHFLPSEGGGGGEGGDCPPNYTIVVKMRLATNMSFGVCNIWVIQRRNVRYL